MKKISELERGDIVTFKVINHGDGNEPAYDLVVQATVDYIEIIDPSNPKRESVVVKDDFRLISGNPRDFETFRRDFGDSFLMEDPELVNEQIERGVIGIFGIYLEESPITVPSYQVFEDGERVWCPALSDFVEELNLDSTGMLRVGEYELSVNASGSLAPGRPQIVFKVCEEDKRWISFALGRNMLDFSEDEVFEISEKNRKALETNGGLFLLTDEIPQINEEGKVDLKITPLREVIMNGNSVILSGDPRKINRNFRYVFELVNF